MDRFQLYFEFDFVLLSLIDCAIMGENISFLSSVEFVTQMKRDQNWLLPHVTHDIFFFYYS